MADFEDTWARDMRCAIAGDAASYRRVLEALALYLRRMVRQSLLRYGRGTEDVEDIVQESLLAIHLKRHTWDVSRPIVPWVRAIATNKIIDAQRRRGSRMTIPVDDVADTLTDVINAPQISSDEIDRLIGRLHGRQRDVLQAVLIEEATMRDVAARFSMTEGAVRVTLHRGLKALATALKEREA